MKKILLTLASGVLLSNAAIAVEVVHVASVSNLEGLAVVSRGGANLILKNNMVLLEGDKVAVLEKSTLQLTYADCLVRHQQNTLVDVSANAPCAVGRQFGVGAPKFGVGADVPGGGGGAGGGGAGAGAGGGGAGAGGGGAGFGGLGALLAGGIAAAIAIPLALDDDDVPASPTTQ